MTALKDLAKVIETPKLEESKIEEMRGDNVRTPSLIVGQPYLGKSWKVTVADSDNPWMVLRFNGSGNQSEDTNEHTMFTENPRIKDMKPGDFYSFDRISEGKIEEFRAYEKDNCLTHGDPAVRLTFFTIKDVTVQEKPAPKPKEKAPKIPKEKGKVGPAKRKSALAANTTTNETETSTEANESADDTNNTTAADTNES